MQKNISQSYELPFHAVFIIRKMHLTTKTRAYSFGFAVFKSSFVIHVLCKHHDAINKIFMHLVNINKQGKIAKND